MVIDIDSRQRTLIMLWFMLLMSLGVLFVISLFIGPANGSAPGKANSGLIVPFAVLGALLVIMSMVIKLKVLAQSVEKQDVRLVQQALVIAFGMCEACALLGLVEHFVFGKPGYYLLFLLAAAGFILHFPKRAHLVAASPKIPMGGATS
ncbi:MAG: hypothetical protein JWM21_1925 [Acidobacteria bacterium]|nr:hypothetical protein [Acidobacteriota bacterium]